MSDFYGAADEAASIATLHRAIDLGVTFLDTADVYGPFTNEKLVGKRHRATAATQVRAGHQVRLRAPRRGTPARHQRAAGVRARAPATRRSRGSASTPSTSTTSIASIPPCRSKTPSARWPALVAAGKVRYLGLSEAAPATLRRAHAVHPIAALQTEYSLWSRDPEGELLATCRELGIGFVAYSPLGRGFLTGRFRSSTTSARRLAPPEPALSGRRTSRRISTSSTRVQALAARRAARRRSWRWPGCWRRATTSCRSPGRRAPNASKRTPAPLDVTLSRRPISALAGRAGAPSGRRPLHGRRHEAGERLMRRRAGDGMPAGR